jgi:hypothetical protein
LAGAVTVIAGGVVSRVVVTEEEAEPKAFVAVAVSVFAPWLSGTWAVKVVPETVAELPFTVTVTGGVPETVPLTLSMA